MPVWERGRDGGGGAESVARCEGRSSVWGVGNLYLAVVVGQRVFIRRQQNVGLFKQVELKVKSGNRESVLYVKGTKGGRSGRCARTFELNEREVSICLDWKFSVRLLLHAKYGITTWRRC